MKKLLTTIFLMVLAVSVFATDWHYTGVYGVQTQNGYPVLNVGVLVMVDRDTWGKRVTIIKTNVPPSHINYYIVKAFPVNSDIYGYMPMHVWVIQSIFPGDEHLVIVPFLAHIGGVKDIEPVPDIGDPR